MNLLKEKSVPCHIYANDWRFFFKRTLDENNFASLKKLKSYAHSFT